MNRVYICAAVMGLLSLSPLAAEEPKNEAAAREANIRALCEKLLTEKSAGVRVSAAKELAELGPAAKGAVPTLTQALKDRVSWVRGKAAEALAYIGPDAAPATENLIGVLRDREWETRLKAAIALAQIGTPAKSAAPVLRELLSTDKDADVRAAAAFALRRVGADSATAEPALRKALSDSDRYVRLQAAVSLAVLAPKAVDESVAAVLREFADDADGDVRAALAEAAKK